MKNTKKVLLVKYGEIALRKKNRAIFEHKILDAIRHNLKPIHEGRIHVVREQGRFLIENKDGDLDIEKCMPLIENIFGIAKFCFAVKTSLRDIADLRTIGLAYFKEFCQHAKTFKIETKRSEKTYPMTSQDISISIGEEIWEYFNHIGDTRDAKMKNPDVTLWCEIRNDVYFYVDSKPGLGGLPYGSSGKGVVLLSGGFDSPVAAYLAARRGVEIMPMYFHSPPFVSERTAVKVEDIANQLVRFTGGIKLLTIPFTETQLFLKDHVPPEKLTIFLKRAMMWIASKYGETEKAHCIIMGDSIGQVASQTLHSMHAVNSSATLPIIRPLSVMDKDDILTVAEKIGTREISARPYDDCCTLFVAKHPENKPSTKVIEARWHKLFPALEPIMLNALEEAKIQML